MKRDPDVAELRKEVAALRREVKRLRDEVERTVAPTHYSSSLRHGSPPPGKSHRWFREHAPEMPGAYRLGSSWAVSVDDSDAWVAKNRPRRTPRPIPDGPWSPETALASAGIRHQK